MTRLFVACCFLLFVSTTISFTQTYAWNYFQAGNYIIDYEAKERKHIVPNSGYFTADFEIDTIAQKLMILTNDGVVVQSLDGTFVRYIPLDYFGEERKIKIDPIRRKMYLMVGVRIYVANYDGSGLTELVREDTEYIDDLAIDPYHNKMYWRNGYTLERIRSANLDGTNVQTVFQKEDISDLQFDINSNELYFRDYRDRKIEKLDLKTNTFSTVYSYPNSTDYVANVFLDATNRSIYFQTSTPYNTYKLDLEINHIEKIYDFEHRIDILKAYQGHLFVNINSYQQRRLVDLDLATNEIQVITAREEYLNVFQIDEASERWIGTTPFGSVMSTDMFGNVIKEHLPKGMNTVIDIQLTDDKIIYLDGRHLYSTDYQFGELSLMTTLEELSPTKMTLNPNDNKIYIVSRWAANIYRCNLDGSEYEKFLQLDSIQSRAYPFTDIVFSDYNDKFYLTTREDSLLVQMDENGSNLITLKQGDFNDDLTYLTLDNTGRYLYYRSGKLREIYRLDLETNERIVYASDIPTSISSMYFHPIDQALYGVNGADDLIYKFENGVSTVAYQEDSDVNLASAFAIDQAGNYYAALSLSYEAIRRITPSLSAASSQLKRNYRYGNKVVYDADENELWGVVKPNLAGNIGRPFKLDLDTDEMTHFEEVVFSFDFELIPKDKMVYSIEQGQDRSIIRSNLETGAIDTILYIDQNFVRYTNIFYNDINERIYFSRSDNDIPLQSTDVFGNDLRIENYSGEERTMVASNQSDTTITFLDARSDDRISRWNFITGEYKTYGEAQEEFFKLSWDLIGTYYENIDEDNDGFNFLEDCDDTMSSINPNAVEIPDNDIDENCDGIYEFTDEDGDGVPAYLDCDDQDSLINIYALEIPNNDIDENCDDIILVIDNDNDGFNSDEDCDDFNAAINPGAIEIPNNYVDEDCDDELAGTDDDGDGFFISDDCDDTNPDVNPNMVEIPYNGVDDDCDANTPDDDLDGDGYNMSEECDDTNPNINPDAVEIPYNGIDEDCDPLTYDDDLDQDGFVLVDDCDDENPAVNSSQNEIPYNALDDDCDPLTPDDDLDGDGFLLIDDCDDENPDVNPDQDEIVGNGIDDDCDDLIDEVTGVHQLGAEKVLIFPNPTNQFVFIQSGNELQLNIKLHNNIGQLVFADVNIDQIDVSDLVPGAYLLTLEDSFSGDSVVEKIIVID